MQLGQCELELVAEQDSACCDGPGTFRFRDLVRIVCLLSNSHEVLDVDQGCVDLASILATMWLGMIPSTSHGRIGKFEVIFHSIARGQLYDTKCQK